MKVGLTLFSTSLIIVFNLLYIKYVKSAIILLLLCGSVPKKGERLKNMTTEKLYLKDVYLTKISSTILEISSINELTHAIIVVLDKTIFFPASGGQPCDLGTIHNIPVIDVYEKNRIVYHTLAMDPESNGSLDLIPLEKGQVVCAELNWNRRFDNMQRHCGEHILSGIFFREYGGINRGFHMGDSYMTIDIDLKDLNWDQAKRVELLANQAVWSNLPVTKRFYNNKEEAEKLPLRKALALDEDITIVCVGNEDNPADCVACCGTHPSNSGEVGLIKIIKLESYKGMTRVYFKAGQEAFLDYQNKNDIITKLNTKYSTDENNLIEKIAAQDEKNREVRQELYNIKASLLTGYAEELLQEMVLQLQPMTHGSMAILVKRYKELMVTDLLNLGRQVSSSINGLLILVCPKEYTVLLFSKGTPDCGKLVRDNAGIYNGKGGGNATNARALFTKEEYLETFIDLIEKHLK